MARTECGQLATISYIWPGEGIRVCCADCAQQIQGVAEAIGVPFRASPIGYKAGETVEEFPICKNMVRQREDSTL